MLDTKHRSRVRGLLLLTASSVAVAFAGPALSEDRPVTWEDIVNDQKTNDDVLMYGMGVKAQPYATLDKINVDNVALMKPKWSFSFGDEKQRGQEGQALVRDGMIYITASYSRIFALDAKTGKKGWSYAHRLPDDIRPCCDVVSRGAAIYGDKIYFGTLDAAMVALDRKTGKVIWNKKFDDHQAGYASTGAPIIAKDAKSGKELWKIQTGSGVVSAPTTFELDGKQYVTISSGYGGAVPLWGGDMAHQTKLVSQGGSFWVFEAPTTTAAN